LSCPAQTKHNERRARRRILMLNKSNMAKRREFHD
jgi:hypothetical protein